ncbi:MAG: branched-chain amino acid ABC transporter ATP-binding protein [Bradyrhizobiaceae bacterium PARB1]|nr:MAG: branched-chain amino acid ABC transporter ATP-binding protein [Bradyrhizobiaceae bacterium PARB1]
MLRVSNMTAGYGALRVLHGVDLEVGAGEAVAVLGANGAGKSTLLRCLSGLLAFSGEAFFLEQPISGVAPHRIVRRGLIQVPEARHIFPDLTVLENLLVGGTAVPHRRDRMQVLEEVLALFPILAERRRQQAGTMSGGQQQMLAIGRALMGKPRLLILDEPSLGLAPMVVRELYQAVRRLIGTGLTVLLVEQDVTLALQVVARAYVLEGGRVALTGSATELRESTHVREHYLGC